MPVANIGVTSFLHVLLCSGTCYDHRFSTDLTSLSHELLPCQADVHTRLSAGRAVLPSKVFLLSGTIIPTSPTHRGHSAHNREHTRRISRRHRKQAWQSRELSARRGRSSRADWWSFHEHFLGTSLRVPCRYVSKFQLHCIVEGSGSLPVLQSRGGCPSFILFKLWRAHLFLSTLLKIVLHPFNQWGVVETLNHQEECQTRPGQMLIISQNWFHSAFI